VYLTGFYSKDFILESAFGQFYFSSIVVYFIATIGAIFTTLYALKTLYLTFLSNPHGPLVNYRNAQEGDLFLSLPLIILAIFSIFFGYITKDIYIGLGSAFFADNSLFIHPSHEIMIDTEFAVPTIWKLLPFFCTIFFSALALTLSEFYPSLIMLFKFSRFGYNLFGFFNQRFLIEMFYNKFITGFILRLGGQTTKILDKGSIELIGPFGLEKGLLLLSKSLASLDTGVITTYALYILTGLIFFISIPFLTLTKDISPLLLLIFFALLSLRDRGLPSKPLYARDNSSRCRRVNQPQSKTGTRQYSTVRDFTYSEFLEWFRGLVDGEGSFRVIPINPRNLGFGFEIGLHKDDIKMLQFIQQTLQIGKVTSFKSMAYFRVGSQEEIKKIIDIFSKAPLNTTKQLNFLDFKKAFELYTGTKTKSILLRQKIDGIINNMNNRRLDQESPKLKDFIITPYWFLGFVEGEGSFSVKKGGNFLLVFSLCQSSNNLPLMEAIKYFICNLPGDYKSRRNYDSVVSLSTAKAVNNSKPVTQIAITNNYFLRNVLVPFFDSMVWRSKKELDFKDWKTVMSLKEKGQHFSEEGKNVIRKILNQMNNNRLSTNSKKVEVDGTLLQLEIKKLLAAPSNLEIKQDGRIFIKSLNKYYSDRSSVSVELHDEKGLVVNTFGSIADCAKFLSISPSIAGKRLLNKEPVLFNNKLLHIKKSSDI
jgi:NADH-ubiquinone oxidoreductase chain 5